MTTAYSAATCPSFTVFVVLTMEDVTATIENSMVTCFRLAGKVADVAETFFRLVEMTTYHFLTNFKGIFTFWPATASL